MGYLRPHQVNEFEDEKRVIERTLENRRDIQDRAGLQNHIRRIDHQIDQQAPPDVSGEERDRIVRECREIEEKLVPLMPSDEEMRRNPPGVVGRHMKYEKAAKEKTEQFPEGLLARWKDNQLILNKGSDDPDIANFERMRPLHSMASMQGAQIPGRQYFGTNPTQAYLEGHDRTFGDPPEEPRDSVEEVEEVEEPAPRKRKKATRRKAYRKKSNGKGVEMTALACGKMMGPHGRHFHVAKCEICKEAARE